MIKKFKYIKEYGVFKNFIWDGNLPDFKEKNIIYGWNYSGKTTLSRLFTYLNEKRVDPLNSTLDFKLIHGDDNKEITPANLDQLNRQIHVFNSDYIKKNLKWDNEETLDPISFDVGENVSIRAEIEKNKEKIDQINGTNEIPGKKEPFEKDIEEFQNLDTNKISLESKKIKNDIFNSLIDFTKKHFDSIKNTLGSKYESNIIKDQKILSEIRRISLAVNDKDRIDDINLPINISSIKADVLKILLSEPSESEIITALDNNADLYIWSQQGLNLHSTKKLKTCSFCGNPIHPDRIKKLTNYFSNESAILREKIKAIHLEIKEEETRINSYKFPKSKNDFTDSCKEECQLLLDLWPEIKQGYINCLQKLLDELNKKEGYFLFNAIIPNELDATLLKDIDDWKLEIQKLVDKHNNIVDNFDAEQTNARNHLKNHYVSTFLKVQEYYELKSKHDFALRCIERYRCLANKLSLKNTELESQLKSILAGKEELNKYIKTFLYTEEIKIEVTDEDKFLLKRGEKYAHNLSEGEKTAIAFAYFLVVLESLHKEHKLENTIIYIDDPVSSLDANHIAQIYSLINSFFFRKGMDSTNPEKVTNCFKQLFISTHNFEFFSFLRDSSQINKRKKIGDNNHPTCEYYLIKRIENDNSVLQPLPKSIKTYKSEYIYLFEVIYKYYKNGCLESDEGFILIPNAIRRFLEIYTLMKIPHLRDDFENRVNELMGDINQLKLLNHFSHFTSFEKLTKYDDLIMNLPAATEELFQLLLKDEQHLNSLKRAINV